MTFVEGPVFLVGSERSGTTLLRLLLDHHPRIAFNLESDYLVTQILDDGTYPEIAGYRDWLRNDRSFQHSRFNIDERLKFVELLNDFLRQKRVRDNKEIVGATVHHQFRKLHGIWPEAKYIYLLRDGRDVANSVMRMGWAGNVYVAADWWLEAEREWDELRSQIADKNRIEVRYEDLVTDAQSQLERICSFLGVEYSAKMHDYVKTSTYQAPNVSLCYQWKAGMRRLDVQRLEEKLGERLSKRGYELSGHPRISISPLAKRYLYLHSRLGAYRFRLGRFGTALTLQETLTRRLGLKRLNREATRRMDRARDAHLK